MKRSVAAMDQSGSSYTTTTEQDASYHLRSRTIKRRKTDCVQQPSVAQASKLLFLPTELRRLIFTHLFRSQTITICVSDGLVRGRTKLNFLNPWDPLPYAIVLRICRQLYHELKAVMWESTVFELEEHQSWDLASLNQSRYLKPFLSNVQRLVLQDNSTQLPRCFELLSLERLSSLKNFTIFRRVEAMFYKSPNKIITDEWIFERVIETMGLYVGSNAEPVRSVRVLKDAISDPNRSFEIEIKCTITWTILGHRDEDPEAQRVPVEYGDADMVYCAKPGQVIGTVTLRREGYVLHSNLLEL